ncbi:MAG: hypothetical protein LKG56_11225, partial [Lachnospiraceae bacterium]|nr:hypothetical protein [Lachnospiraceae bacterium]
KRASQERKYRNQPKNWFRIGCYIVSSVGKVLIITSLIALHCLSLVPVSRALPSLFQQAPLNLNQIITYSPEEIRIAAKLVNSTAKIVSMNLMKDHHSSVL